MDSANKNKENKVKDIFNVTPMAHLEKSPPSTLEEVFTIDDPTPPTEAIDDLASNQTTQEK